MAPISKERRVLFMTNAELGQASVILAVASELQHANPSLQVHLASFPSLSKSTSHGLIFHGLPGLSMKDVLSVRGFDFLPKHAPGINGAIQSYREALPLVLAPWNAEQYIPLYEFCCHLIQDIDPALVVLDPLFGPGADACEVLRRQRIVLSPSAFKDHVGHLQPRLEGAWKYNVMSSGLSSPIPLTSLLTNIYLIYKLFKVGYFDSTVTDLLKARNLHGIPGNLTTKFTNFSTDFPYLVPATKATDYPLVKPPNLIGCGPIIPAFTPLRETDPELAGWLASRPTLVVNMGSHVTYSPRQFEEVKSALVTCMRQRPDMQVLWKCQVPASSGDQNQSSVDWDEETKDLQERMRVLSWLPSTPVACLTASPSILGYVHHGGSNSFHEALAAGVPQVVCPVWLDTYDFASRAEYLGVGVWGNKKAAPGVERGELAVALTRVLGSDSGESVKLMSSARALADQVGGVDTGRRFAADFIADAARRGDSTSGLETWNDATKRAEKGD